MTKQAKNMINLCLNNDEQSIRMALKMTSASVRDEIISHYGGSFNDAVVHLHFGTR